MFNKTKLIAFFTVAFLGGALCASAAFAGFGGTPANAGAGWGGGGGTGMDPAGMGPGAAGYISRPGMAHPTSGPPATEHKDKR